MHFFHNRSLANFKLFWKTVKTVLVFKGKKTIWREKKHRFRPQNDQPTFKIIQIYFHPLTVDVKFAVFKKALKHYKFFASNLYPSNHSLVNQLRPNYQKRVMKKKNHAQAKIIPLIAFDQVEQILLLITDIALKYQFNLKHRFSLIPLLFNKKLRFLSFDLSLKFGPNRLWTNIHAER